MSSSWRANVRSWILLVVALVPTIAVFVAGITLWAARTDEINEFQKALTPIETTFELFSLSHAIDRASTALAAAAAPGADAQLVAIAEREVAAASEQLRTAPDRIESLVGELADDGEADTAQQKLGGQISAELRMASAVLDSQEPGTAPTTAMAFLTSMSRANAGGLVFASAASSNREVAFYFEAMAATVEYWGAFSGDAAAVTQAILTSSDVSSVVAQSPLRAGTWKDLVDSRQFTIGNAVPIDWAVSEQSLDNPLVIAREEPLLMLINDQLPVVSAAQRDDAMLALLAIDADVAADVTTAYVAIQAAADAELAALHRDRLLITIATIVVSIVGVLLMGLTSAEIRQRRRVERAHAKAIDQLADRAYRDPTTGLWNRRRVEQAVSSMLIDVNGTHRQVALAYVDLDSFKAINDVWGHHTGDSVLRVVAQRLSNFTHGSVSFEVSRFGGDEFVLYGEVRDATSAWLHDLGSRLIDRLSSPITVDGREHRIRASAGIAVSAPDSTLDSLLLEADSSLILAKQTQRGTAIVYDRSVSRNGELVHELPRAIAAGEITCHLQPILSLQSGTFSHAEALARWTRANGESVGPGEFIPLVESFGLAEKLTSRILEDVAELVTTRQVPDGVRVWMNLPPRELEVANFADRFVDALAEVELPASRIGIEITETAAVRDPVAFGRELDELRAAGVGIAIDDFGNGYSPLGLLSDLPVDVVKLDRSLIAHIDSNPGRQAMVQGIVGMLRELGIGITAEGVERPEEAAWLVDHDVDALQGFLYATPTSPIAVDWEPPMNVPLATSLGG